MAGMMVNGYSIQGIYYNGQPCSAMYNGEVVWPTAQPIVYRSVEFGEGNTYSAGLTAEYDGTVVYSSPLGTAKRTATGIPEGSKITFCGSSPKFLCFVASSFTGISGTSTEYDGSSRDGVGSTSTGILTAEGKCALSDGHQKTIRVEGNFPNVPGAYRYATIYCRVTGMSSWIGDALKASNSSWLRSNMTGSYKCLKSNNWGAGNSTVVTTWLGRNCSAHTWSGWCNTTAGGPTLIVTGYLERAAGFTTFGHSGAGVGSNTSWGSVSNQTGGYFAAGRMTNTTNKDCASNVNGWWWASAYAP